jgi:hypothetical protein
MLCSKLCYWPCGLQVLELVAPERQPHAASTDQAAAVAAGCEQQLVLHQLAWQLEAMQALLQLQAALGTGSASECCATQIRDCSLWFVSLGPVYVLCS